MNDDTPKVSEEEAALHARVRLLRQEHADLDASIEALGQTPTPDQLLIARLKRKKLVLRDEIVERQRAERLQRALFRISEMSVSAGSLLRFYADVHEVVNGLVYAENFYIAMLVGDGERIEFPYSVDERDPVRPPQRAVSDNPEALGEGATMVANRLRKNLRKLKAWREREGVSCYRVYDADLPEYAAAIDVYIQSEADVNAEGAPLWLHIQEYAAPAEIREDVTRRRFGDVLAAARELREETAVEVAPERLTPDGEFRYRDLHRKVTAHVFAWRPEQAPVVAVDRR